jgi:6-phospho-beta-glucosidase
VKLLADLRRSKAQGDLDGMLAAYRAYLGERGGSYMVAETGRGQHDGSKPADDEGYAGVALDLIEALSSARPRTMILNVPNRGAMSAMAHDDVVEIPAVIAQSFIRPLAVGDVPDHCLGLIKQVRLSSGSIAAVGRLHARGAAARRASWCVTKANHPR